MFHCTLGLGNIEGQNSCFGVPRESIGSFEDRKDLVIVTAERLQSMIFELDRVHDFGHL
jgi:hypothetical protein